MNTTRPADTPTFADVRAAAQTLRGIAHRTPVMRSRQLDEATGAQIFFKCENLQRIGAFKFRGAYNAVASLSPAQRAAGVLAFSSGNHAQAIALSARLQGAKSTIVMPRDAPAGKLAATRGYGAEIVLYDRYTEDREAIGRELAERHGYSLIPPFDHPQVIAGQGTAALELFEEVGSLDALLVCVGGGGLISGCALAAAEMSPACEVIGVEPAAGNDVQQSLAAGRIVRIPVPDTLADGAQTAAPGEITFALIKRLVSRVLTVPDASLVDTMRWFAERMKLVVEPTGCLGAAAVRDQLVALEGRRIGVIVSGGNVDIERYARLLASSEPN